MLKAWVLATILSGCEFGCQASSSLEAGRLSVVLEVCLGPLNIANQFFLAVMPAMPQMPSIDASLAWMGCDLNIEPSQHGFPDL